ncbi:hypothetical protein BGZ52_011869, partial [Haplosporangium bisporale]
STSSEGRKFAVEIKEMKTVEIMSIPSLEEFRAVVAALKQGLLDDLMVQHRLLSRVSASHLDIKTFQQLIDAKVYDHDLAQ